jgi:glucose 1-dehydrogenase
MKLQHKVVFITDGDSGSGKALIHRLSHEGADFIVNSQSSGEHIQDERTHCIAAGSKIMVVHINVCDGSAVSGMLDEAAQQLGPVDVLVHNNNLILPISVETGDEERFLAILNANAKSAFVCTQAVGKQMMARQSGSMIYVSSIHAEKPTGSSFAYSASKGAVKMLTREAALCLGRYGVTVNSIEMGPVEGDDSVFQSDISTLYEEYEYKVPNAELGTYADLASLVCYLCSGAARHMNGADIRLDGGFVLHYMDHKRKKPVQPGGVP